MGMRWSFSMITRPPLLSMFSTMSFSNVTKTLLKVERREFCFQDCLSLLQTLDGDFKASGYGKSVHCLCLKTGFASDVFVQNNLMRFYAGHGDLDRACQMFDEIPEPNLVSWTTMISSHVHIGRYEAGLSIFNLLLRSGSCPNEFAFSLALKACRITREFFTGLLIHGLILKSGFESDTFCSSAILRIYLDYGQFEDAIKLFDGIPAEERSEASWNTLIDYFVQMSSAGEALELYKKMRASGVLPNKFTYSVLLKLCSNMFIPLLGRLIHGQIVKLGFEDDVTVGSALVDVYAKLGLVDDSCCVFRSLKEKDNIVWCALLSGLHQIGDANQGLNFYSEFLSEGNKPDPFTFSLVFSLCSTLEAEYIGTKTHCSLVKCGFEIDSILGSSLISMYHSFGMVMDAYECFLEVRSKDDSCFSVMINALVSTSNDEKALELFLEMKKLGFMPSHLTISYILRSLTNLDMIKQGKTFHSCILKSHYSDVKSNLSTENALIEMYGKCGPIAFAEAVFKGMEVRNEYSWTTLMGGFGQFGKFEQILGLFRNMVLCSELEKPSRFTVVAVLQACTKLGTPSRGRQVHNYAIKLGFSSHPFVGSSLVAMYSTCRSEIRDAFRAFSSMREHDIVSWSAMLTAWVQSGHHEEALKHFFILRRSTLDFSSFDETVFSTCLSACAGLAATETGKSFHAVVIKVALDSNPHVASSIVDMYSKCGLVNEARRLFNGTRFRNLVTWTAMISGYAYNGLGEDSVQLFNEMKETGIEPDSIAFVGVLSACSHAGLVREGRGFFESMKSHQGLEVTVNHYACMVDLFGRNEQVDVAESLIEDAPFEPASKYLLWRALLGACNTHGNVRVGNRVAQKMLDLRPREPSTYVLLSNIYASASMWDNSIGVRSKMKEANVVKQPGSSWVHAS